MVMLSGVLDSRMDSSPWRSTTYVSVRKVSAGFGSFSRNHAAQAFSVSRISRTFSRARRIFRPGFPMDSRYSCTRSLGELQPACAGLEGLQGLSDGAITEDVITGGVSQGESASLLAAAAGYGVTGGLSERLMQGALSTAALASGGASAALRINLAACGNAVVPEKLEIKSSATARMLRWAEYITFSRPDP